MTAHSPSACRPAWWQAQPGSAGGGVLAVRRLDVFARQVDGTLAHYYYGDGTGRGGPELVSGSLTFTGPPAAVSWEARRLGIFVRGDGGGRWHWWHADGMVSAPEPLGGSLQSPPAVVSWGNGRLDVFGEAPDHTICHWWYEGGWGGPPADRRASRCRSGLARLGPGLLHPDRLADRLPRRLGRLAITDRRSRNPGRTRPRRQAHSRHAPA